MGHATRWTPYVLTGLLDTAECNYSLPVCLGWPRQHLPRDKDQHSALAHQAMLPGWGCWSRPGSCLPAKCCSNYAAEPWVNSVLPRLSKCHSASLKNTGSFKILMSENYTFKPVWILKLGILSIITAHENIFYSTVPKGNTETQRSGSDSISDLLT